MHTKTFPPIVATVRFKTFVEQVIPALLVEQPSGPQLLFTDGYCLGRLDDISLDYGIDTSVPGGDSSYHHHDLPADALVHLCDNGFYVDAASCGDSQPYLHFIRRSSDIPAKTVGELAAFLVVNPFDRILEGDYEDSIKTFVQKPKGIEFAHSQHYEDIQEESRLLKPDKLLVASGAGFEVKGLPDSLGYLSGDPFHLYRNVPGVWNSLIKQGIFEG